MSVSQNKTTTDDRIKTIPRNPSDFSPTTHFADQYKWRNFQGEWIAETIAEGIIRTTKDDPTTPAKHVDPDVFHFVNDIEVSGTEYEFHLVFDYNSRDIITGYIPGFKNDDYRAVFPENR